MFFYDLKKLTKNEFSLKKLYLLGLPSEIGGVFIGLILSTYHYVFFFIAMGVSVYFYTRFFKYLYQLKMGNEGCIGQSFYYQILLAQILFLSCFLVPILWR